jgi:hypothetical protein
MNEERKVTTSYEPFVSNPYVSPEERSQARAEHGRLVAAASREAGERDMAYLRALSGMPTTPQQPPPQLRQPVLPSEFVDAMDAFDDEILRRGISVSRDKILALGRKRFGELLSLDRAARQEQRVVGTNCDLTSWTSVHQAFFIVNALGTGIRPRKTSEVWTGCGEDRERAGQFAGFADLWKSVSEPRAVRAVYAFRDKFESLVFGLSMLDRIAADGRLHSKFFSSGKPVGAFADWLSVLEQQAHVMVTLTDPVGDLVCWLAHEGTPPPRPLEYAKDLRGVRAPSVEEIKVAAAVWRGFALGYTSLWDLWNFIGGQTRVRTNTNALEIWRNDLVRRYPAIERFHSELAGCFYKPVGGDQFLFDSSAHRLFVDGHIRRLSNRLGAVIAMAVEEALPQSVVARFSDSVLAVASDRTRHKAKLDASVFAKVQAAFPRSNFQFVINEGGV